jgi:cytochrome P450
MIVERKEVINKTSRALNDDTFKPQILIDQLITKEKNSGIHLTNREISDESFTMVIAVRLSTHL